MKTKMKKITAIFILTMVVFALSFPVYAVNADAQAAAQTSEGAAEDASVGDRALAAAIAVGLAAGAGAVVMGIAIAKSADGIARQPEAEGKIRTTLMLGLVFIETAIIYALIVAILVIFVL